MIKLELLDILILITIFPLFFYSVFLMLNRKKRGNKFLSLFLFTNGIYLLNFLLVRIKSEIQIDLTYFYYLGSSFSFIFGPSLYLYTKSITIDEFKWRNIEWLHFIPFILSLTYYFAGLRNYFMIYYGIKYLQIIIYFFPVFQLIKKYQHRVKQFYSSIEKIDLNRLKFIYYIFLLLWLIDSTAYLYLLITGEQLREFFNFLAFLSLGINFIFATLLLYFSMTFSEAGQLKEKRKYESSRMTEYQKSEHLNKLKGFFKSEKIYLNSSITLNDISKAIGIPAREISQIINESLNKNFFDFINYYRIEEATELLKKHPEKTILEIMYESGFNSKSAFNTAFKKQTGQTPSKFRSNLVELSSDS